MPLPYAFSSVTTLHTDQLDADFNALGSLTVIPCAAVGTNTIALTPSTNTPTITAYSTMSPVFAFIAANTNTGATTINVNGAGPKAVYKNNGAAAIGANDLIAGQLYYVAYNPALNTGSGGFVIMNQGTSGAAAGSVQGTRKNVVVQTTSNTQCTVTADAVAVSDGSSNFTSLLGVSVTISSGVTGAANGLDVGPLAASTAYAIYVIYNPSTLTTAGLMSASFTAPTLPSGYTEYARVGSQRTDGSSNFLRILQKNERAQYVIGTNPTIAVVMASSIAGVGSIGTSPTLAGITVTSFVPPTASKIHLAVYNNYKAGGASNVLVAPNVNWGGANNGPSGSGGQVWPIYLTTSAGTTEGGFLSLLLESSVLGWRADGAGGVVACIGWDDNL